MRWTQAQQAAIEARECNLLVSAAAGSGKTAVLAERIVSLVKEGVHIDALLVVTFTRAAAAEMRARILTALHAAADAGDIHLANEAMRVERADISTLHGFCGQVCRDHFQAAGVDPTYRVAEGAQAAVLRSQALTEALTACYERPSSVFEAAAACFSQEGLLEAVESLYSFLMARPDPWQWLNEAVAAHDITEAQLMDSPWMDVLMQRIRMAAATAVDAYGRLTAFTREHGLHEAFAREEAAQADAFYQAAQAGYQAVSEAKDIAFRTRPRKRKDDDAALMDQFASLRDAAKDALKAAAGQAVGIGPLDLRAEDELDVGLVIAGLREAVEAFHARFAALKAERNLMDFHDLEHHALRALNDASVADAMATKYAYVFVDEYQDSSLLQEAILARACRADNLFMVGDVKQSIYRFRLAEPSLFLHKLHTYRPEPGAANRRIALNANFRAHATLLDGVNGVFDHVFTGGLMELTYEAEERLVAGRVDEDGGAPVELHLLTGEAEDEGADVEDEEDAPTMVELSAQTRESIQREADIIAARILALQEETGGAYSLRDMAVLMRTVRGKAALVVETLRAYGIMAWSDLGEDALGRTEVKAMVSLLETIDNLRQDVPLLAALRGPALGLREDALAAIRVAAPEGSFADAMLAYAEGEDALAAALRGFIERVRGWALDAQVLPLDRLLQQIYEDTGFYAQSGALPDGDIRQANLRTLAEHAGQYQRAQAGGLGGFMRYLERVKAHEGIAAQELGEHDDVVRVLSIHKSKGLQFPVVFVAGLGRRFVNMDARRSLHMHAALGIGMPHVDPALRTRRETISGQAVVEKRRQEALAEEARVLYVAMTRAQERLILVGTPPRGAAERWQRLDAPMDAARAGCMLDWIVPVARQSDAWQVHTHGQPHAAGGGEGMVPRATRAAYAAAMALPAPDSASEITRALSWQPDFTGDTPIKRSVSSVTAVEAKQGEAEHTPVSLEAMPQRPLFMEKRGLTAAERGDAVHAFLRAVPMDAQDLDAARRSMVEQGLLSGEQARSLSLDKLSPLMRGPLWARMREAQALYRERPFNLRVEEGGRVTLLQGVIDCCFLEDGAWTVVDYKSDRAGDPESLAVRYTPQLALYARALTEITGMPVRRRVLYLIEHEEAVDV